MSPPCDRIPWYCRMLLLAMGLAAGPSCRRSSGGGARPVTVTILEVSFPDPLDQNLEPLRVAPMDAPLNQQVQLFLDDQLRPSSVPPTAVQVTDEAGTPVPGTLEVKGRRLVFTPALPTRDLVRINASQFDVADCGLRPGSTYTVRVGPSTWPGRILGVDPGLATRFPDSQGLGDVEFRFTTTRTFGKFLKGLPNRGPRLVKVDPRPGKSGVSPNLYTDPDRCFARRTPFVMTLDGPVHPGDTNLGGIQVRDLDDTSAGMAGLLLGADVTVLVNRPDQSQVQVMPSGILPFGHLLALEYPKDLRGISQNPKAGTDLLVASTFTVAKAPNKTIRDLLREDFGTTARIETDPLEYAVGEVPADWDQQDSDVLTAAHPFAGGGALGRFQPYPGVPGQPRIITLNTSVQVFPLMDGSTPDAPPGFTVTGGVFPFTTVDIPQDVILQVTGPNPLVFVTTGDVTIDGVVDLKGGDGTPDMSWDRGEFPNPGGSSDSGGGRGGNGHPSVFAGVPSLLTLVDPPAGDRGWGSRNLLRIGGRGGQGGMLDLPDATGRYGTDAEIACTRLGNPQNNGFRGAGGGGGSFLVSGTIAARGGQGNVLADGLGNYQLRTPQRDGSGYDRLSQGGPGDRVFIDGDPSNDFVGLQGELSDIQGGQGGGGGGSAFDSYYCGVWCLLDQDPANDDVCQQQYGFPPSRADSVSDRGGGGGGGGGGAFQVRSLGRIRVSGSVDARGGRGGGGEWLGCGNWGGCGGGGSGGAVILQSAKSIRVTGSASILVDGGEGERAVTSKATMTSCLDRRDSNQGTGGDGSDGIIQLQLPLGRTATVNPSATMTRTSWVDPTNTVNPAPFGNTSVALTRWYDLGRTVDRLPLGQNPRFQFLGLNAAGFVQTDGAGNVLDPANTSLRCDYLGQLHPWYPGYVFGEEPRQDYVPTNATVRVEFQGADAIAPGSKQVDPATVTGWQTHPAVADGMQFLRWRITFDVTADGSRLTPGTRLPSVQWIAPEAGF